MTMSAAIAEVAPTSPAATTDITNFFIVQPLPLEIPPPGRRPNLRTPRTHGHPVRQINNILRNTSKPNPGAIAAFLGEIGLSDRKVSGCCNSITETVRRGLESGRQRPLSRLRAVPA